MHIPVLGLDILDHDTVKALKKAAGDAGHEIVSAERSAISDLWQEAKAKFPNLVEAIQHGIADMRDASLSGGDKAVKVAMDVLPIVPAVLADLPDLKGFLVHAVTEVFATGETALEKAAAGLVGKL